MPYPGGLPDELKKTLVESPLLPMEINSVAAAPTATSGIDYPIGITYNRTTDEVWVAIYTGAILVLRDR